MSMLAEAERLMEAARFHKRAARQHRAQAVRARQQLDALIAAAASRGITIDINRTAPGGHSGHHSQQAEA